MLEAKKEVPMKTTLFTITLLICGGLLLTSFNSSPVGPITGPLETQTYAGDLMSVQFLKPDTLMGDHLSNYPDPFCSKTTIEYEIIHPTWVNLMITCPDQKNISLVFGFHEPGTYSLVFDACNKPCGCYIATLMTYYATEVEIMNKIRSPVVPMPGTD
jgi:hypothetical protein